MKHCLIIAGILLVMATGAFAAGSNIAAQDVTINISQVNLLRANGAASFAINAPETPGDKPVITSTQNATLAYTSILPSIGGTRKINAKITTALPAGLQLSAEVVTGTAGVGNVGSGTGSPTLLNGSSALDLVSGIGSCYTVTPTLSYSLDIISGTGMKDLLATDTPKTAVVTYTMTDASSS